jgi:hypothetical protein
LQGNNRYNDGDTEKFKEGYRKAVPIPWSERRKTKTCQYTESGKCDSPACIHTKDGCFPKGFKISKNSNPVYKQFQRYYNVGLGRWIESPKHYKQVLREMNCVEVGDCPVDKYKPRGRL